MDENQTDQNQKPEEQHCPPGSAPDCCSAPQDGAASCCGPSARSPLKTAVFVLIMLAAVSVAAISIWKKSAEQTRASTSSESGTLSLVNGLESVAGLADVAADKDAVFVLLRGESVESGNAASGEVTAAVGMLSGRGKRVASFTLDPGAEGYSEVIEGFEVEQLPAVIVAARGRGPTRLDGEITQMNLVSAFVKASAKSEGRCPVACPLPGSE